MALGVPNPLRELGIAAARWKLGLARSWGIAALADRVLQAGVYSDGLARLAELSEPIMSDVEPLFLRALEELAIPIPSREDAAWFIARDVLERVDEGIDSPETASNELYLLVHETGDLRSDGMYFGEQLDLAQLMGIGDSYDCPNENYYEPEARVIDDEGERRAILDRLALAECRAWLERHPCIGNIVQR